jgi:ABC-type Fe3+/spermidine/putrescine transport system ATPase subunit
VTHDQEEAMALSDRVVIMNRGIIEQQGAPEEVFDRPATAFTAKFLGYSNEIRGRIERVEGDYVELASPSGLRVRAHWRNPQAPGVGGEALVAFRADHVSLVGSGEGANVFAGKVEGRAFLGTYVDYAIRVGELVVEVKSAPEEAARRGDDVFIRVAPQHCHAFPVSEG